MNDEFHNAFHGLTDNAPFPWQIALHDDWFSQGKTPRICDIPTGLGKTRVIAVWLIALANGATLPRRLVYVVNRRTVVDQTTTEAENLRNKLRQAGLWDKLAERCSVQPTESDPPLAISTLRGQFTDNQQWSADPARPAIIVGTVDMIGSRLLFEGYRIGFKSRPLHAGFLGQDALLVHDEAHLEPAFQKLIKTIKLEQDRCKEFTMFHVMELTATTRNDNGRAAERTLNLEQEDRDSPIVKRRIEADKTLQLHSCDNEEKLAESVAELALSHKDTDAAILIFVRKVDDVTKVVGGLTGKKGVAADHVETLTGTMRGLERDRMADPRRSDASRVFARFLPRPKLDARADEQWKTEPMPGTVYLVCTSAGEVGANLSADHMVCDLSTFDSMAQRLGRVNRFGERTDTRVDVVYPKSFDDKKPNPQRKETLDLLHRLNRDASPKAISDLLRGLTDEQRKDAFAPEPTILPATDILFDAWALTTIQGKMPGRPPIEPYLHGLAEWEPPRTSVAWREEVEHITDELNDQYGADFPQTLLDDYPLKPHELLSDTSERVFKSLQMMHNRLVPDPPVWIIDQHGQVKRDTLSQMLDGDRNRVIRRISDCTILLPPSAGGLSKGMLDGSSTSRVDDVADEWFDEAGNRRRLRFRSDDLTPLQPAEAAGMALSDSIDLKPWLDEQDPPESDTDADLQSESDAESADRRLGRYWHWYTRLHDTDDATRASTKAVSWDDHTNDVVKRATEIVAALKLPDDLRQAVILAAKLHDLGKKRETWQRSIGNPHASDPTRWVAKSDNKWKTRSAKLHIDYRHEFGSLLDTLDTDKEHTAQFEKLSPEMRDVVLHLIAAHHGYARPHFPPNAYDHEGHTTEQNEQAACDVMRRFARLQRRYGRWGLAYLESLLRAADWAASANPTHTGGDA